MGAALAGSQTALEPALAAAADANLRDRGRASRGAEPGAEPGTEPGAEPGARAAADCLLDATAEPGRPGRADVVHRRRRWLNVVLARGRTRRGRPVLTLSM